MDEILHGTNSHDRRIGAEGVVSGLIQRGAIGLVTTHDLALTRIVEELPTRAANVHFEDHLEGGRMTFDYLLRRGVLQRSNALELMRSVDLKCDAGSAGRPASYRFPSFKEASDAYHREFIQRKLDEADGNVSRAAKLMGIDRSHLPADAVAWHQRSRIVVGVLNFRVARSEWGRIIASLANISSPRQLKFLSR